MAWRGGRTHASPRTYDNLQDGGLSQLLTSLWARPGCVPARITRPLDSPKHHEVQYPHARQRIEISRNLWYNRLQSEQSKSFFGERAYAVNLLCQGGS